MLDSKYNLIVYPLNKKAPLILIIALLISCSTETTSTIESTTISEKNPGITEIQNQKSMLDGVHISSDRIIDGYTNNVSCLISDSIVTYLNANDSIPKAYVKLYTINGIKVDSVKTIIFPQKIINLNPWENGFGYKPTFSYKPSKLKSGIYLWENRIPFIVKSSVPKNITVVYPSNTENAYCESGGRSMYSTPTAAGIVSFQRPIQLSQRSAAFLQWAEESKFIQDFNYIADSDLDDPNILKDSKLLIIIGHSEYWTRQARLNFDHFIDQGNNAILLSGNNMWWQVRYDKDKNQLICYKNKSADQTADPLLSTINWYEESLKYPILNSVGADFNLGGYGLKEDKGWDGYKICANNSPLLEGTNLSNGDIISLPTSEYDGAPIKEFGENGFPVVDNSKLDFYKNEIIAFDYGFRDRQTCGTFLALQKKQSSGIIINTATTDWCSSFGMGGNDGKTLRIITQNMIEKLLNKQDIFSTN